VAAFKRIPRCACDLAKKSRRSANELHQSMIAEMQRFSGILDLR
jgi:hypothetical protein